MEEEEMIFDPSLKKKKKKKKTPFEFEASAGGENHAAETPETVDAPEADGPAPSVKDEGEPLADDFSGMKKKKKKTVTLAAEAAAGGAEADDGDLKKGTEKLSLNDAPGEEASEDFDFNQKKKSKKDKKVVISDALEVLGEETVEVKTSQPIAIKEGDYSHTDRDYTYEELLNRVFNIMKEKNPEMVSGERKKFVMKPPQVSRLGTKKTAFANFAEICKLLHRQPKHLLAFMLAELGTSGSVDGSNSLIIKGRFQQKQIESVLRRYIKEYVTCHTCRSPETNLERDTRLFFLQCTTCGSRCSVASIKSGFQALTGKRAAIRAKET